MGKGRGKGADGCCNNRCKTIAALVVILVIGLAFAITGLALLVSAISANRANLIKSVDAAVLKWSSSARAQFGQLSAAVFLTPRSVDAGCRQLNVTLSTNGCPTDLYTDAGGRSSSVPQLKLCGGVAWSTFTTCNMQVDFRVQQPNTTGLVSFSRLPDLVSNTPGSMDIRMDQIGGPDQCNVGKHKCYGGDYSSCRDKCASKFRGSLRCTSAGYTCAANAYTDNLAIKVSYAAAGNSFAIDTLAPSLGSGGGGANILRKGFTWISGPFGQVGSGPSWQYNRPLFGSLPSALTFTVRSSADPWLTYMAVTGGSGDFGADKRILTIVGSVLVGVGGLLLLCGLLLGICMCWGDCLVQRSPKDRPDGCAAGKAWGLGTWLDEHRRQQGSVVPLQMAYYPAAQPVQGPYYAAYAAPPAATAYAYPPQPQQQPYPPPPPYGQQPYPGHEQQPYPGAPPPPQPYGQQPYPGQEQHPYPSAPPPPQPYGQGPPPPPPPYGAPQAPPPAVGTPYVASPYHG